MFWPTCKVNFETFTTSTLRQSYKKCSLKIFSFTGLPPWICSVFCLNNLNLLVNQTRTQYCTAEICFLLFLLPAQTKQVRVVEAKVTKHSETWEADSRPYGQKEFIVMCSIDTDRWESCMKELLDTSTAASSYSIAMYTLSRV